MEPITKKEMKKNYGKLKKLICRVMDYNLKHDVDIFIDVSPHVKKIEFIQYLTHDGKWAQGADIRRIGIYYRGILQNVEQGIKDLESWLTEK